MHLCYTRININMEEEIPQKLYILNLMKYPGEMFKIWSYFIYYLKKAKLLFLPILLFFPATIMNVLEFTYQLTKTTAFIRRLKK